MSESTELACLRWACRRGMLELDLYFQSFFNDRYTRLSVEQQTRFAELLTFPDPDLYNWLMGYSQSFAPEYADIIQLIRDYHRT